MPTNFSVIAGDTCILTIPIVDENGNALDVSSATKIDFTVIGRGYVSTFAKNLDDGINVVADVVTVTIAPEDTINLLGRYWHELQVIDSSGNVFTALQGAMFVKRGYTE